jgi:transposase
MPKLLYARAPVDEQEERQVRKLAGSRHAPGDWIMHARMVVRSWAGERTTAIAAALHCHPQTVRERLARFNADGLDGLGDRPGSGRPPRLTETERSTIVALAQSTPAGRLQQRADGSLRADDPEQDAHWTLDALTAAVRAHGVQVARSQIRRILRREGVRWRHTHSWAASKDPDFVPKEQRSSRSTPSRARDPRPAAPTNSVR